MKKSLVIIAALVGSIFAGCDNHKAEITQLNKEKDSLMSVAYTKDQTINDFLSSFSEIQGNLSEITKKEQTLAVNTNANPEMIKTSKDVIKSQIQDIKSLMEDSKSKMEALSAKLKRSNVKNASLAKMIAELNEQIAQKDKDITALNDQIASLNTSVTTLKTSVEDLTAKNDVSTKMIEDQTTRLNTAYVAVGSSKQLSEKKVVARHGGVLGLGKTTTLEPNVNQEAFNTIDITKTASIPLNVKDARLVSAHPSDSYKMERTTDKKVTELVITDPAKFWSESKYLVVLTEQ
jgi:predicted RNase H-like nuclease (RuvC/YqgF family)